VTDKLLLTAKRILTTATKSIVAIVSGLHHSIATHSQQPPDWVVQ